MVGGVGVPSGVSQDGPGKLWNQVLLKPACGGGRGDVFASNSCSESAEG